MTEWEPPPDPRVPEEAWPEWLFYVLMGVIVAGTTLAIVAGMVW